MDSHKTVISRIVRSKWFDFFLLVTGLLAASTLFFLGIALFFDGQSGNSPIIRTLGLVFTGLSGAVGTISILGFVGSVAAIDVEKLGKFLSLAVPRKIRRECFEPFFEDLKADRLERIARADSPLAKRWITFCFYLRLTGTVMESAMCFLVEVFGKAVVFFKGGS